MRTPKPRKRCQCADTLCPCRGVCTSARVTLVKARDGNWLGCGVCRENRGLYRKRKPANKVRRVVLAVGHPWFYAKLAAEGMKGQACGMFLTREQNVFTDCPVIDSKGLGNWNRIRLVAEVLK